MAAGQVAPPEGFAPEPTVPPPPEGFVLDSTVPPPPEGFVLDAPPSFSQRVGEFTTGINEGIANLLGLPVDVVANVLNLGFAAYGSGQTALGNVEAAPELIERPFGGSESIKAGMAKIGLMPRQNPTDATGRVLQRVGQEVGATAVPTSRVGRVGQAVGDAALSVASGTAAGVGGEIAGTTGEALGQAGVLLGPKAAAAGARGAARGNNANVVQENLDAFQQAGTTPTVGQATGRRELQATESLLAKVPGGSGPMAAKAQQQTEEMGKGVSRVRDEVSTRFGPEEAGRAVKTGIAGETGFVRRFKQQSNFLYDKLDKYISKESRIDVSNTRKALEDLNADIPGAPNLSRFFKNAKIQGLEGALKADLKEPTEATAALQAAKEELAAAIRARNSAMQDVGKFAATERDQSLRADKFYPVEGLPRISGRYSDFPERASEAAAAAGDAKQIAAARVKQIQDAEARIAAAEEKIAELDGKLPYESIKKLRTLVGNEITNSSIASDVPKSKWKALYAALSRDLESAAQQAGPAAERAYKRANQYHAAGSKRIEDVLDSVVGRGEPEKVYQAVVGGARDGATTIRAVKRSLKPEEWEVVQATVIDRLGRATPGRQNEAGDAFSPATFLTNWNRLSKEAKMEMFPSGRIRSDLDHIAKAADRIKESGGVFANPSGTAGAAANIGAAGGALALGATGQHGALGVLLGGVGLANVSARVMTSPKAVKWLAESTVVPPREMEQHVKRLYTTIQNASPEEKESLEELYQAVKSQTAK